MGLYIGMVHMQSASDYIFNAKYFFNCYIDYKIENNKIVDIPKKEKDVLVSSLYNNLEISGFKEKEMGRQNSRCFVLNIDDINKIQDVGNKKVIEISDCQIYTIDKFGIYVVYDVENPFEYKYITDDEVGEEKVIMQSDNYIFGLYRYEVTPYVRELNTDENGYVYYSSISQEDIREIVDSRGNIRFRLCMFEPNKWERKDVLPDKILLSQALKNLSNKNELDADVIQSIMSQLPQTAMDKERIDRVKNILNTEIKTNEEREELVENIKLMLLHNRSGITEILIEYARSTPELLAKISQTEIIIHEIGRRRQELNRVAEEAETQKLEIMKLQQKIVEYEAMRDSLRREIEKLDEGRRLQYIDAEAKLNDLNLKINKLEQEHERIRVERDKEQNNHDYLVGLVENKKIEIENYNKRAAEARNTLKATIGQQIQDAIDGIDTKKIFETKAQDYALRAALNWDIDNHKKSKEAGFEQLAFEPFSLQYMQNDGETEKERALKFIDALYERISATYVCTKKDIVNFVICLKTGFLTVLEGKPGTGKTSMCSAVAESLGLLASSMKQKRFLTVSVEKGWTSKRDLLGFYNSLTNEIVTEHQDLLDAFYVLSYEANQEKIFEGLPFVILLDEANLSLMEYYWSDFMNVADLSLPRKKRSITMPDGKTCYLP